MKRLSRPQSPGFPLEPPPQWCLSPLLQRDPDQAARPPPVSAAPDVLYLSCFAQECEAVVFHLSKDAEEARPLCSWTIQEETLTPLEPPCSFLDSPGGLSPSRPVPEPASASAGPPDPSASVPCSEQSTGLAGIPLGAAAQLAATPSVSGLAGVSWPEWEKASPPPSEANVTHEVKGSGGSANATFICPSALPALEIFKWELPFITSTPLMTPSLSKDASPKTLCTECPRKPPDSGLDSKQKWPADLQPESGFRVTVASNHRSLPVAASSGADQVPPVSGKASFAKRSLSLGGSRALRTRGVRGVGGLPKGTGTTRKSLQPAGRKCSQNFVMPPNSSGPAVQSQPVTQKLLSDEITKTELHCNKKPSISMQPPSKLAGRFGVQGSLACLGLNLHGIPRDNNASGTRLPVFTGSKVTAKASSQKRPWEKPSDKATASPLKQPFPKRSRLCKGQKEKSTCNNLMAVGQIPNATLEKEFTPPCSQCQLLAEENKQLKSMLETCRKTIAFLEGKQNVVENENCPPQTEAT